MSPFLFPAREASRADALVVCFPHAGGNLHSYHAWAGYLPPELGLYAYQPPGRGVRVAETPVANLEQMVGEVLQAIEPLLDRPCIFYGHSFGGLLAYEVACALRMEGRRLPQHFIASACLPPSLTPARRERWVGMDDDGMMFDRLAADGGIPVALRPHREAFLPLMASVRAEYRILANYEFEEQEPLPVPLSLFHATRDRLVGEQDMSGWTHLFRGTVDKVAFIGDHFFVDSHAAEVAGKLNDISSSLLTARAY
jgi:surfactin synthase thioesterase subunit